MYPHARMIPPYTQAMTSSTHETVASWTLPGSDGQPLYGNTHLPTDTPLRGIAIISHGFKGYKDYGFIPRLASHLSKQGLIVHRFNFSHSGMTNNIATFEKPELFERDTWNRQAADLQAVADAAANARLPPIQSRSLPQFWIGHSRGGLTTLLTAGRAFKQNAPVKPAAIITLAAGDSCCRLDAQQRQEMHEQGYLHSPSSRTGQLLRIGLAWLAEQEADPQAHDLLAHVRHINCPMLVIHGQSDDTVPFESAKNITAAAGNRATLVAMPQTNHTFDAPNPLPADAPLPPDTRAMFNHVAGFIRRMV